MAALKAFFRSGTNLLICLMAVPLILANAASNWYAKNSPDLALFFNPANPDARIRLVESQLTIDTPPILLAALQKSARNGIWFEPYDSRLYSLLGLIGEISGEPGERVQANYVHALSLDPTELRALVRRYAYNAFNGNISEALTQAELLYRSSPNSWNLVEESLPVLLAKEEGYNFVLDRFTNLPSGPSIMLNSLAKTDAGMEIARKLILDWSKAGVSDLRPSINSIVKKMLNEKKPIQAFLLFGLSLNEKEREEAGFVFNDQFNLPPNGSVFDWQLPNLPGVGAQIIDLSDSSAVKAGDTAVKSAAYNRAMEIRFLNTPVRLDHILQTVRLPAASLSWSVTYSTKDLAGPNPVRLRLRCLATKQTLGQINLEPTLGDVKTLTMPVRIPSDKCALQEITISNDNLVESWQNRYSGSLVLRQVKIELAGG